MIAAGVIGGWPGRVFGLIDWLDIPFGTRRVRLLAQNSA
jgi:hypothetical protein